VKKRSRRQGSHWRILAWLIDGGEKVEQESDGASVFDELVIQPWLHLEQIQDGVWWLDLGGFHLGVRVDGKGRARVTHNGQDLAGYGLVPEAGPA